jgi:hypothetical protein
LEKQLIRDPYEQLVYQSLQSMLADLPQIDTREDQQKALHDVHEWYKIQNRLIDQRKDQGNIRYEMSKDYR